MSWWAMTQLAQRSAEQEKQLATAGEEDLQPVQAGPAGKCINVIVVFHSMILLT